MFLDFSKAFDKAPNYFPVNLSCCSINRSSMIWVNDLMSNGIHAVSVNGCHSTQGSVSSGVSQECF